ncbi:MAG: TadE/TadG family type IV pilus assembly protein [Chloroflexota bacterium]
MATSTRNNARRCRGQSLVELALLLPMLVMILLGALDLGRAFYSYAAVANATRTGAAYAINATGLTSYTVAERVDIVKDLIQREAASQVAIARTDITVTPNNSMTSGTSAVIEVKYTFRLLNPLAQAYWGNDVEITYSTTIRYA